MFDEEEWRPIPDYEGIYEVSGHGRVRSVDRYILPGRGGTPRLRRGAMRTLTPGRRGHLYVPLFSAGRVKTMPVHQLVLLAFVGPRLDGMEGCHNNGVPDDNRVENLRWGTRSENSLDMVRHGDHWQARKTECKWGHEYTAENTLYSKSGRYCRQCSIQRHRGYRQAAKLRRAAA